nr:Chain P, leader peptide of HLA class I histocompatibility antigen, Cw-7 alpha chain [synthetic construct]3BZF_Q Chain Q, leader peptide of HLA class I histocompatibility antigen, Cw-7 alpha chain [synthetic construct]
VMAPRALLL